MAKPRATVPAVRTNKSLADFPGWVEANEKLQGFQNELDEAATRLKSELAIPREKRISEDAAAVLAGGDVATQVCNIGELQRRRDVLTATIVSQERLVETQRRIAAKEIVIELLAKQRATVERFIKEQEQALATYDAAVAIFTAADAACGGAAGLPELGVPSLTMLRFRHDFQRFKALAGDMLLGR